MKSKQNCSNDSNVDLNQLLLSSLTKGFEFIESVTTANDELNPEPSEMKSKPNDSTSLNVDLNRIFSSLEEACREVNSNVDVKQVLSSIAEECKGMNLNVDPKQVLLKLEEICKWWK